MPMLATQTDYVRRSKHDRRSGVRSTIDGPTEERRVATQDRRAHRSNGRVPLSLPVRVRTWGNQIEPAVEAVTRTFNVSRTGLYFESVKTFKMGQPVRVALNFSVEHPGDAIEQPALVVRVYSVGGSKFGVALKYL